MLRVHTTLKTLLEFYESAKKQNPNPLQFHNMQTRTQGPPSSSWLLKKGKSQWWKTSSQYHQHSHTPLCTDVQLMCGNSEQGCPQPPPVSERGTKGQNFSASHSEGWLFSGFFGSCILRATAMPLSIGTAGATGTQKQNSIFTHKVRQPLVSQVHAKREENNPSSSALKHMQTQILIGTK